MLSFSDEHKAVFEEHLCVELDSLRTCTAAELDKLRIQCREMYERETRQAGRQGGRGADM